MGEVTTDPEVQAKLLGRIQAMLSAARHGERPIIGFWVIIKPDGVEEWTITTGPKADGAPS